MENPAAGNKLPTSETEAAEFGWLDVIWPEDHFGFWRRYSSGISATGADRFSSMTAGFCAALLRRADIQRRHVNLLLPVITDRQETEHLDSQRLEVTNL